MNKKIIALIIILVLGIGAVLFFTLGGDNKAKEVDSDKVVEENVEKPDEKTNVNNEEESENNIEPEEEKNTIENTMNEFDKAGKEINLTEEEMKQLGEEAVKQFQQNLNLKTMEEFDVWYKDTMYDNDYYEIFKNTIQGFLNKSELISVEVTTNSVYPNSSYSYQWTGTAITKYKDFEENLIYTETSDFMIQMYETERGSKDYKIIRMESSVVNESTEPLQ